MIGGGHGSNAVLVAWAQKTMLRPRIKRAAAVAFINAVRNTSQVNLSYPPQPHLHPPPSPSPDANHLLTMQTTGLDIVPLS